jgi:hypothetical protein
MQLLTPRQKRQRRAEHGPNQQSLRFCLTRDALRLHGAKRFHVKCGLEEINSRETCSVNQPPQCDHNVAAHHDRSA